MFFHWAHIINMRDLAWMHANLFDLTLRPSRACNKSTSTAPCRTTTVQVPNYLVVVEDFVCWNKTSDVGDFLSFVEIQKPLLKVSPHLCLVNMHPLEKLFIFVGAHLAVPLGILESLCCRRRVTPPRSCLESRSLEPRFVLS